MEKHSYSNLNIVSIGPAIVAYQMENEAKNWFLVCVLPVEWCFASWEKMGRSVLTTGSTKVRQSQHHHRHHGQREKKSLIVCKLILHNEVFLGFII